ncbi:MAG: hypothetical protein UIJ87_04550 [Anaerovoracaceae bacterium]|nr:hypothetical protein [Anaerovoracaceae bacterium]
MRRKLMMAVVAAIMVLTMIPATAFAATPATPTGTGTDFFANGVPVTITKEKPQNSQKATLEGFTEGTDAYISWTEGTTTKYVGATNDVSVYGGKDGSADPVTVESTSITMTGGEIYNLYGGNLGKDNDSENTPSVVTGNVEINISGRECTVVNVLHGGGRFNSAVNGTATINIENAVLTGGGLGGCYINGGSYGNGHEGKRNIDAGTMNTNAVVKNAVINIKDSKVLSVFGGGSGNTKTENVSITLDGVTADSVFIGGTNGEVVSASIDITGNSQIETISATNRGFVGTVTASIGAATINKLNTGATKGCFTSDSGTPDGSGVTGEITWNIGEDAEVKSAFVTPLIKNTGAAVPVADFGGTKIVNKGENIDFKIDKFVYDENPAGTAVTGSFTISENKALSIEGVTVQTTAETAVSNKGTIDVQDNAVLMTASGSSVTNEAGATIAVSETGKVQATANTVTNEGVIDKHPNAEVEGVTTGEGGEVVSNYATIDAKAGKGGAITPSGTVYVHEDEEATFTITPDEGYVIADVKVDGKSVGNVKTYTFKDLDIGKEYTIEASFKTMPTAGGGTDTDGNGSSAADKTPATGDESGMMLPIALMAMAAAAGATAFVRRRSN